ncbi:carbon-nitrogen family hydrolase [Aminobacterium sp. MB27-C1]|jgi:omega-amidase|uniref:carbon-nitrogen family hydrolase n=1 Tax=Aminobacterium sp. MB27-C1 TaxID=3070661 RepID=UPI001BD01B98|nr:carbon-nitrogen family hydrolase [Aminobacterium sp. MB27-C1]WMI72169.1 carbon-nitrogen family hydrolase [Aminobacterium sp. MB27-C1]
MIQKIALLQMDIAFADPVANRNKAEEMICEAVKGNPDVICLSETWNVGFFPKENLKDLADVDGQPTKELLGRLASKYKVNIVGGSVANRRGDKIYNTGFVFDREGKCIAEYDKIHGFSPSGEHTYFEGGSKLCTFELDGIKAGMIICYDMRFLELVRTLALDGIQILFIPAQWPHPRLKHWKTLAMARAIENQMFVAAINGVGTANDLKFCGNSMLIDPWGEILVNAGEDEKIVMAEADFSIVEDIRERINVFRDRKPEFYKL